MKEYKVVDAYVSYLQGTLDKYAKNRWELIHCEVKNRAFNDTRRLIFEREKRSHLVSVVQDFGNEE